MSELIVSKFGGTSNADAESVEHSMELGRDSNILVPSAPGRLSDEQLSGLEIPDGVPVSFYGQKITDQLLAVRREYRLTGKIPSYMLDSITNRYWRIVKGLGGPLNKSGWVPKIGPRIVAATHFGEDYASMLGERLQAEIYESLGWHLLDPARAESAIPPREPQTWKVWMQSTIRTGSRYVLPGNTWFDGERLHTFSRGGSDISGALAAYATGADIYRNWTDTSAQSISPELVRDRNRRQNLRELTYLEGRELGRNGTGLLHPEAIVPLMGSGIVTEVRNTFDPEGPLTLYTDELVDESRTGRPVALSLIKSVAVIAVHEPGMSETAGRVGDLAAQVGNAKISLIDNVGYGSDSELFLVDTKHAEIARQALEQVLLRGKITSRQSALITIVGFELVRNALKIRKVVNDVLGDKDSLPPLWLEAPHALRVTAPDSMAEYVIDRLHAALIED